MAASVPTAARNTLASVPTLHVHSCFFTQGCMHTAARAAQCPSEQGLFMRTVTGYLNPQGWEVSGTATQPRPLLPKTRGGIYTTSVA